MRKGLYWTIIVICIATFFMIKDHTCIKCIEAKENIRLITSIEGLNELVYKYMCCPSCK